MSDPQAEPLDHLVVMEIARILGRIRVANGYRTDYGEFVLTEENPDEQLTDKSCIEVYDTGDRVVTQNSKSRSSTLTLTIDLSVYVVPGGEIGARQLARRGLADMRKALTVEARQFPNAGVTDLTIGGRTLNSREDGSNFLVASLDLTATLFEKY